MGIRMHEHRKPQTVKFSSLSWLVNFLNLQFNSKNSRDRQRVKGFHSEGGWQDDAETALNVQQKMVDLLDLAIKGNTPEELGMALNDYVARNSESLLARPYPPVRVHWYVRRLKDVAFRDAGQAVLKMGNSRWVVEPAPLMFGTEGKVWLSVIQCMVNGELGRIRRCLRCRRFFVTDDARRKFCTAKHQRDYDAEASKMRVKASREKQKADAQGLKPPEKKLPEPPPSLITDAHRFADFLKMANGSIIPGSREALFIKKKIPGEWRTVMGWLKDERPPDAIWTTVAENTKDTFRDFWG